MTATPDTPQPPGSQRVDGWEPNAGKTFRYFAGQPRGSAAEVKIGGFQGVVTPNPHTANTVNSASSTNTQAVIG